MRCSSAAVFIRTHCRNRGCRHPRKASCGGGLRSQALGEDLGDQPFGQPAVDVIDDVRLVALTHAALQRSNRASGHDRVGQRNREVGYALSVRRVRGCPAAVTQR